MSYGDERWRSISARRLVMVDRFTLVILCDLDGEEVTHATSAVPIALAIARMCLEVLIRPSLELTVLDLCSPWIIFIEL
jgi:hypothetical protein